MLYFITYLLLLLILSPLLTLFLKDYKKRGGIPTILISYFLVTIMILSLLGAVQNYPSKVRYKDSYHFQHRYVTSETRLAGKIPITRTGFARFTFPLLGGMVCDVGADVYRYLKKSKKVKVAYRKNLGMYSCVSVR